MIAVVATAIVVAHLVIVLLHGEAHADLGVELTSLQTAFAAIVIVLAPLIASALLWTRWRIAGLVLLSASMAGSLIFGIYHHYLAVSPDHVSHLPPGGAQGIFRVTALLLPVSEAAGFVLGLRGLSRRGRGEETNRGVGAS